MSKTCLFMAVLVMLAAAGHSAQRKKLIEYGWDVPDTAYLREHIAEMEKIPFDGVVFKMNPRGFTGREFGWRAFGRERFDFEEMKPNVEDVRATKFKRFTDNFVQLTVYPGDVDWFDPAWSDIAHNCGLLARVAKQAGCKGIMFDPEAYGQPIWQYSAFKPELRQAHTFMQYARKVRLRGREFMAAINAEYPDITLLCLFGPSAGTTLWAEIKPEDNGFGLLRYFYQGMLDVAAPGTIIVDGWESSYGYRESRLFVKARKAMLEDAARYYDDPKKFAQHVRCGFGVWVDYDWRGFGWSYDDFSKNYHSPKGLRASLAYALELSDEYVWVYSEELRWWNPARAPKEYIEALALAKKGPGTGEKHLAVLVPRAAKQPGYSDEETFAEMRKTMTEVFDLPKDGWKFWKDPSKKGEGRGCWKADFNDSKWRSISIGSFWEEQGEPQYDGCAWYRVRFVPPALEQGRRVFLVFGAVDEQARVWLNGRFAGSHDEGPGGWDKPFALDVTGILKPGEQNTLAVQVVDTEGAGGIWKSVKVMAK